MDGWLPMDGWMDGWLGKCAWIVRVIQLWEWKYKKSELLSGLLFLLV